jgi:DNA-binding Lrp family transcriptional regulator
MFAIKSRMLVEDIVKETSLSTKTVARRLEKMMIENHILQFTIFTNPSPIFYAINRVYRIRNVN